MSIVKSATALWSGGLKDGKGQISTQSGVLKNTPYGFKNRFEGEAGTNPEELIAAAHAGCYSMALSMILGQADMIADKIETKADVTLEKLEGGFEVTKINLMLKASVPNADESEFMECAVKAKENCPISKLLNADITLDVMLNEERLAA